MEQRSINAPDAPAPVGPYSQAVEISGFVRIVHISGQIPAAPDGSIPKHFDDQCRLAWANVEAQLRAAGMSLDNVVKVTTFLSHRRYAASNRSIRQEVLRNRRPAVTAVITSPVDESWLLELEAVAAA